VGSCSPVVVDVLVGDVDSLTFSFGEDEWCPLGMNVLVETSCRRVDCLNDYIIH